MLRSLRPEEFDRYLDFAYALACNLTRSGFPTYADGVKTREDFIRMSRRALTDDTEEILLFEQEGKVSGWIHYFVIPEDRYLQTCAFCIEEGTREALAEFINFARERFPGYACYLGFSTENTEATAALDGWGWERIEESYCDALDFASYELQAEHPDVLGVTKDNYPLFAALHDQKTDMYWNTERIYEALDQWGIFLLLRDGSEKAAGAIYYRLWDDTSMSEIFGVDYPGGVYDGEVYRMLLTAVLNAEKRRGVRHMVCFHEQEEQPDALACGFRCVSPYVCFKKQF